MTVQPELRAVSPSARPVDFGRRAGLVGKDISGLEMNKVEIVHQGKRVHSLSVQSGMEPLYSSIVAILRLPRHDADAFYILWRNNEECSKILSWPT